MDPRHALNAICPYFTMFPLEFPLQILKHHSDARLVLDPFCGRGTTLYAARSRGLHAVGIDCSPVAVAISQAKLASISVEEVMLLARHLLDAIACPAVPEGEFWEFAFHQETLRSICRLRGGLLNESPSDAAVVLRATLLGCLHGPLSKVGSYFSNQMQRTFSPKPDYAVRFWKKRGLRPPPADVLSIVERKLNRVAMGMAQRSASSWKRGVIRGDASQFFSFKSVPKNVDLVITSPPYYGMRTYVADQWLRNWFLGGPAHVDYTGDGRLPSSSPESFAEALGRTWAHIARKSSGNLHLYIRFGAIPSRAVNARQLLRESLESSKMKWRVISTRSASTADAGKRQVSQMRTHAAPVTEFDLHAVLA